MFNKINRELYKLINDSKYIDFNQRLSCEVEIKIQFFFKKNKCFFLFKIGSLKF